MVHGGGACSGGGGGGFSGGGFSGGTIYYGNYRSRRRNNGGDEECLECVTCCCEGISAFICFSVCCKNQSYLRKALIFWTWLALIFFISGLATGLGRYGPTNIPLSPTDMVKINRGISTTFCEGVAITSTSQISAYLLPSSPVLTTQKSNYSISKSTVINSDRYEYWGFYLLSGSEVRIESCVDGYSDFYVVKGEKNFNKWKDDNFCDDCKLKYQSLGKCGYPSFSKDSTYVHIQDTDEYYFIWANHNYNSMSASINFQLNRTEYDLRYSSQKCLDSLYCKLDYSDVDTEESIVVFVPESSEDDVNLTTSCSRRVYVFILIFMLTPLCVGSLFTAFMFYKKRSSASGASIGSIQGAQEGQAVSYGSCPPPPQYLNTTGPDVKQTAPPYGFHDDSATVKPPSYLEATSGIVNK